MNETLTLPDSTVDTDAETTKVIEALEAALKDEDTRNFWALIAASLAERPAVYADLQAPVIAEKEAIKGVMREMLLEDSAFFLVNETINLHSFLYAGRTLETKQPSGDTRYEFVTRTRDRNDIAEMYRITERADGTNLYQWTCKTTRYNADVPSAVTIAVDARDDDRAVHVYIEGYERGQTVIYEETDEAMKNALLWDMMVESMTAAGMVAGRDPELREKSDDESRQMLLKLQAQQGESPRLLHHLQPAA